MKSEFFEARGQLRSSRPGRWVAADWEIRAEGEPPQRLRLREPALLETSERRVVALDLERATLTAGIVETQRGRWTNLVDEALERAAGQFRPSDHVPLEVTVSGIPTGVHVRVVGQVVASHAVSGREDGYRDARAQTQVAVERLEVLSAPRQQKSEAPRSRRPSRPSRLRASDRGWLALVLGLTIGVVSFGVRALAEREPGTWVVACGAAAFVGTLGWRVLARLWGCAHRVDVPASARWLPEPRRMGATEPLRVVHHRVTSLPLASTVLFAILGVGFAIGALDAGGGFGPAAWISTLASFALALGLLIEDWRATRGAASFARACLGASSSAAWETRSGGLDQELSRAIVTRVETRGAGRGRSTNHHVSESSMPPRTVRVGGAAVETDGARWASLRHAILERGEEQEVLRFAAEAGSPAFVARLSAGSAEPVWRSRGPGSLLLVTGADDPLVALQRKRWMQRLGPAPVLLGAALSAASLGL